MKRLLLSVIMLLGCLALAGCQVTEEKIELWKTTQNGPKKLAGAMVDTSLDVGLRSKAAAALVAINEWDFFREAFQKIERADAQTVILATAPLLGAVVAGGGADAALTREQIDAKDGLFVMIDYAEGEAREAVSRHLIAWCTQGEYNQRAMAGQYNTRTIVRKLGAAATAAMIPLLTIDEVTLEYIANLIREVNDEAVIEKASTHWAGQIKSNLAKVGEFHMVVAGIIGGEALADAMIDLASARDLSAEHQRFALRAFSTAFEKGHMKSSPERMNRLLDLAESSEFDKYHREETYLTIAQIGGAEEAERVAGLLQQKDFFLRLVGLRCLLRMDGPGQIKRILETRGLAASSQEIGEVIEWVGRFPDLREALLEISGSGGAFARGAAILALAEVGLATDAGAMDKLAGIKTRLPRGFEYGTVGQAAQATAEKLKKKGG